MRLIYSYMYYRYQYEAMNTVCAKMTNKVTIIYGTKDNNLRVKYLLRWEDKEAKQTIGYTCTQRCTGTAKV